MTAVATRSNEPSPALLRRVNAGPIGVVGEPGTFVPAHIHPTQDEFIYLIHGEMELTLDGNPHGLAAGGLARMPMGIPHSYKNVGNKTVHALFWVTPARKLYELFTRIYNLTDPAEVVAISATC